MNLITVKEAWNSGMKMVQLQNLESHTDNPYIVAVSRWCHKTRQFSWRSYGYLPVGTPAPVFPGTLRFTLNVIRTGLHDTDR